MAKQHYLGGGTLWSKPKSATAAECSPLELEHGSLSLPIQGLLGRLHKLCSVSAQDSCRLAAGGCVSLPRGEISCPNVLGFNIIRRIAPVGGWPFTCRHKYVLKLLFFFFKRPPSSPCLSPYLRVIYENRSVLEYCCLSLLSNEVKHLSGYGGRSQTVVVLQVMFNNSYPTAFPYGNGMVLHFYQQQESSTTKTVHRVINRGLKAYV